MTHHRDTGSVVFTGIIGTILFLGIILPLKALLIAGKVATFAISEALSGAYVTRLRIRRAYLIWKRDH